MSETVRAIEISRPSKAAVVTETTAVVLETTGMKKSYKMGNVTVEALKGVDISIRQGEFVAIIGPSGSGKSTLLNLVGCLDRPTDGKVLIDGIDVSKMNDAKLTDIRCRKIGYVFQKFYLLPFLTALENVELQARLAGLQDGKKKAAEALRLVGLERAHEPPAEGDVGRRAAACGHRPCAGEIPGDHPGRRAYGQPGHEDRGHDHGNVQEAARAGYHHRHGHAQPGAGCQDEPDNQGQGRPH